MVDFDGKCRYIHIFIYQSHGSYGIGKTHLQVSAGALNNHVSKKSPTGPTERTPKPEYLIALPTYLGVRW